MGDARKEAWGSKISRIMTGACTHGAHVYAGHGKAASPVTQAIDGR